MKKQHLHIYDILPYQTIEENVLILRDGRVCVLFEVDGIELDSWNAMDYDSFVSNFHHTLKAMPDGLDIIKIDIYHKEPQFEKEEVGSIFERDGFFAGKTAQMFSRNKALRQKSYLILTLNKKTKDRKAIEINTTYSRLSLNRTSGLLSKNKARLKEMNDLAGDFSRYFGNHIFLYRLSDEQINELIFSFLNLDFSYPPKDYFSCSIDFSDKRFLNIGQKRLNILTLQKTNDLDNFGTKDYGSESIAQFSTYPTSQFLHHEHITIQTIKKRKGIDQRFGLEKALTSMQVSSPLIDKFMKKAETISDELDSLERGNDDLVLYNHLVMVWTTLGEGEESSKVYEDAKTSLALLGRYNEESFDTANLFFSSLPGINGDCFRDIVVPISEASHLISFSRNYQGDIEGDLYTDRLGNAIRVDFFHEDMHAKNALVIGPTGSGKSFTMGYAILNAFSRGDIQVLIDKGRTYKNLVTALGGKYYEYDEDDVASLSFNPFLLSKHTDGRYNLNSDKIEFLMTLLEVLWKQTEKGDILSKEEKSLLQEKIKNFYEFCFTEDIHPTLDTFVEYVSENSNTEEDKKFFDVMSFKLCMQPFVSGIYKNLFSSKEITRLDEHKLLCFEMEGIAGNRSLFMILTLLIIELVMDFLRGYPKERKHLIIDEAWALFGGEMGNFMEYIYRTIRKMNGRGVVITQSAGDLELSAIGNILVNNSYLFKILNHGGKSTEALSRVLNLDNEEIAKIVSMRQESDILNIGRELYIKRDGVDGKVFSLKVPIEVMPILTSKPSERDLFNTLVREVEGERNILEKEKELKGMDFIDFKRECVFEAIERWVKEVNNN